MSLPARLALPAVGALVLGALLLGAAGAAGGASGQVCMGVVVDAGPNSSEPNWYPVAVEGANAVPGTTSDLDALNQVGYPPSTNSAGLVCAIKSFPDNGVQNCLNSSGGLYYYWSYWQGDPYTNTWTYASSAPASHTVSSGQTYVEGWRYQDPGPDNPTAAKPAVSPRDAFSQGCPGIAPVPAGGSGGGGSGSGSGSGSGGGATGGSGGGPSAATTGGASPSATATTTPPAAGGTASPGPRTAAGGLTGTVGGVTTTSRPRGAAGTPNGTSTTTTAAGGGAHHADGNAALADARGHGSTGGGVPALPVAVVGAVILLLGGLAWWRWGRRPLEE